MFSTEALQEQYAFYGSFHRNKWNVLVHIACVLPIFWGALVIAETYLFPQQVFTVVSLDQIGLENIQFEVTVTFLYAFIVYVLNFIYLEPFAGTIYAPILLSIIYHARNFATTSPNALKIAGIVEVTGWVSQILSHKVFEKNAPALLDSLSQSLVLAVFFVFLEVLFALGYRPELHKQLEQRISQRRAQQVINKKKK